MKRCCAVVVWLLAGILFSSLVSAMEVPLKYEKYSGNQGTFRPMGMLSVKVKLDAPPGEWKLPELKFDHPLYSLVKTGDSERLMILDVQKEDDLYYNCIYFDANANSDLTDDKIIHGTLRDIGNGQYFMTEFPGVDMMIEVDGVSLPYNFKIRASGNAFNAANSPALNNQNIRRFANIYCQTNCSYSGTFKVNGTDYTIEIGDANCNGRFDDSFTKPNIVNSSPVPRPLMPSGDQMYLSTDGVIGYLDRLALGDMLLIEGKLFEVSISTKDKTLTMNEVSDGLVTVKLPMEVELLSLYTDDGEHCVNCYKPGSQVTLPPGNYKLLSYQACRKDKQGDLWRVCASSSSDTPSFAVKQGSGEACAFGEPYSPVVSLRTRPGSSSNNGNIPISFNVAGVANEILTDVARISGDKSIIPRSSIRGKENLPKEPSYKIITPGGEVVATGSFEYG